MFYMRASAAATRILHADVQWRTPLANMFLMQLCYSRYSIGQPPALPTAALPALLPVPLLLAPLGLFFGK